MVEQTEEEYKKEVEEAGVEFPAEEKKDGDAPATEDPPKETPTEVVPEEPKPEEPKEEPKVEEPKVEPQVLPEEPKRRSIYDEYKEKKTELKTERGLKESFEKENKDLKEKLSKYETADTPEKKEEAKDEIEAFAKKIGASPEALRELQTLFLKGIKPDESVQEGLDKFQAWQKDNQVVIEKQAFEKEYTATISAIKEILPKKVSDKEMDDVKTELDKLSHTKEWHDKSLDYIVFKNKDKLTALVSPNKKGMETKERKDINEEITDFDADADLSKMTPEQREKWMADYEKATASPTGLSKDSEGRKIIL